MMKIRPAALAAAATAAPALAGPPVPTFTDETVTRLVAPADTSEKDYGIGDLDLDGDLDVVVARRAGLNFNAGNPLPNFLLMNEDGVLVDRTAELASPLAVAARSRDVLVADLDQDGWLDVLVADGPAAAPLLLLNAGEDEGVWLGLAAAPPPPVVVDAWTLAAGDVVGDDGYPEVFIGVMTGTDRLLANGGTGKGGWHGLTDAPGLLGGNAGTFAVRSSAFADMNDDGDMDIVQGVTGTGVVRMLPNNGAGTFTGTPQNLITGAAYNFGLGHLDDDGSLDIFGVRNGGDEARINTGPGIGESITLSSPFTAPNSNGFGAICRVADLNGDGTDDFLVADLDQEFPQDCSRRLKIYLNSGTDPYLVDAYPSPVAWTPNGTSDIAMIDLDDDGDLDMLIGHCGGHSVFMQDGSPKGVLGDVNHDGKVDVQDLIELLLAWGACPPTSCPADLDDNGVVDVQDLVLMLLNWGA
jgi:hypothetical protein